MRILTENEVMLCRMHAKIFEKSVDYCPYSSPVFIRRIMMSSIVKTFDDGIYPYLTFPTEYVLDELDEEFGKTTYGTTKFSKDEMFWIGYIYRAIAILYKLSSKQVYKLFKANEIVKYYNTYHTFDIVYAAERMMESIGYKEVDLTKKGIEIMKRYMLLDEAKALLHKKVEVFVDRKIGYNHKGLIYPINYGYIKNFKSLDGEYMDAYIIGESEPLEKFDGEVIAVINRLNDNEDKLVVSSGKVQYTKKEIEEIVHFQEQFFKTKIIM